MTQTLYGFIQDESTKLSSRMTSSNSEVIHPKFGELSGETRNYIILEATLNDSRDNRSDVLNGQTASGKLNILFDELRFDIADFDAVNLTKDEQDCLFNIIERTIFRGQMSDESLETTLTNNRGVYDGYVPGTFLMSDVSRSEMNTVTTTEKTEYQLYCPHWIEFDFSHGEDTVTKFHLWYTASDFKEDYPYITITKVISPIKLTTLINPDRVVASSNIELLQNSSSFIFDETNLETIARDQNGVRTFFTKYVLNDNLSMEIPFALVYCGAHEPQPLECRAAIKQYIEASVSTSREHLKAILPELFISHRFYIVPVWDMFTERPDREVYNSMWHFNTIREKADKVYRNTDPEFVDDYLEIFTQAQSKTLMMSLPDDGNEEGFSLREMYPTYQDYSTQVPGWKYMSAADQDFAGKVIRAMAVLNGELISNEFTMADYGPISYISFISGSAECLIMTKESYLKLINV